MSLTERDLIMFLTGSMGVLLFVVIVEESTRRYRGELIESGGAQTTLGSIGCVYLEGKAQILVATYILIIGTLMGIGSVGLLTFYLGVSQYLNIIFFLMIGYLFLQCCYFWRPGSKARQVRRRVMWSYWAHRNEEILRLELVVLSKGDKTKRRALELIAKRGCKASLVARKIIAGAA